MSDRVFVNDRVGAELPNGCRLVSLRPGLRFLVDRDEVPVLVFVNDRVLPCRVEETTEGMTYGDS